MRYKRMSSCSAVRQVSRPPARSAAAHPASLRRQGSHLRPLAPDTTPVVLASSGAIAREEMVFAGLGLALKTVGFLLALITLTKLALAHQQRLERHGEIKAVLQLQLDRLDRQKHELDRLFSSDGHQTLFRREEQWIAPNRRRIIWLPPETTSPSIQ